MLFVCFADSCLFFGKDHGEFMTLVAGKRPSLLMVGDDDEVYDKKLQLFAEDNVTQWEI